MSLTSKDETLINFRIVVKQVIDTSCRYALQRNLNVRLDALIKFLSVEQIPSEFFLKKLPQTRGYYHTFTRDMKMDQVTTLLET